MKHIDETDDTSDQLVIVWTSGDVFVAERMVFMYANAAVTKGFFKQSVLIIWGPSAKLAAENLKLQQQLTSMQNDGLLVKACITCAKEYGVEKDLRDLGFEVKAMGKVLTGYLKSNAKILTF